MVLPPYQSFGLDEGFRLEEVTWNCMPCGDLRRWHGLGHRGWRERVISKLLGKELVVVRIVSQLDGEARI